MDLLSRCCIGAFITFLGPTGIAQPESEPVAATRQHYYTGFPNARRIRVVACLETGSVVLDVGCGAGVPADTLFERSHRVVAIDISGEQIRSARAAAIALQNDEKESMQ